MIIGLWPVSKKQRLTILHHQLLLLFLVDYHKGYSEVSASVVSPKIKALWLTETGSSGAHSLPPRPYPLNLGCLLSPMPRFCQEGRHLASV